MNLVHCKTGLKWKGKKSHSYVTKILFKLELKLVSASSYKLYVLLTKPEDKMVGYWPSSFYACL